MLGAVCKFGNGILFIDTRIFITVIEVFLTHILNCKRIDLVIKKDDIINEKEISTFFDMVNKRKNNMPVSYITKTKEFMSLDFFVDSGILIPRPETELLVEEVISHFKGCGDTKILDLCTGSGAICVSLAHYLKNAKLTAVDKFDVCIDVANKNAESNDVKDRIDFIKADILSDFKFKSNYNCIVSNPPYIKSSALPSLPSDVKEYEPDYALDGGDDGLIFYKKIVEISKENLEDGGLLAFEIGFDQGEDIKNIIKKTNQFHSVNIKKDYAGLDRIVTAVKGITYENSKN